MYELREHADYNYRLGDVVLRLSNDDPPDGSNSEGPPVPESVPEDALSWVGEITGLENGSLRILWADGQASCVSPQKVFVVRRPSPGSLASRRQFGAPVLHRAGLFLHVIKSIIGPLCPRRIYFTVGCRQPRIAYNP